MSFLLFKRNSNQDSNQASQAAERLESLKAGMVGKLTAALVAVPLILLENLEKKMPLWIWGVGIVESMVLFGAIALSLNWAMGRGWIQRMK